MLRFNRREVTVPFFRVGTPELAAGELQALLNTVQPPARKRRAA
jgi:hypothetical protein